MDTLNYDNMIALHEETIKNLYRLTEMSREALHGATMLNDKLSMERLRQTYESAGRLLRTKIFDAEDANKHRNYYLANLEMESI